MIFFVVIFAVVGAFTMLIGGIRLIDADDWRFPTGILSILFVLLFVAIAIYKAMVATY